MQLKYRGVTYTAKTHSTQLVPTEAAVKFRGVVYQICRPSAL